MVAVSFVTVKPSAPIQPILITSNAADLLERDEKEIRAINGIGEKRAAQIMSVIQKYLGD